MKKNILSLVAFMAFSVSAFANTVEVKEEVVISVETEIIFEEETNDSSSRDCFSYGINVYYQAENAGITDEWELICAMNTAISLCEGWTWGDQKGC
jgi:hypothetical protein